MNRKLSSLSCIAGSWDPIRTHWRLGLRLVLTAREERRQTQLQVQSSKSPRTAEAPLRPQAAIRTKWPLEEVMTFPFWIKIRRSPSALRAYLCIDRDVQKQHRTARFQKKKKTEGNVSPATNILFLRINTEQSGACTENVFCLVISNNFWLQTSEDERSKWDVCGAPAVRTNRVGMKEGAKECACQVDPGGERGRGRGPADGAEATAPAPIRC